MTGTEGRTWGAPVLTLVQRGSVVMGGLTCLGSFLVLVWLLVVDGGSTPVGAVAALLALVCGSYLVLIAPKLTVHMEGVRIHNPLRRIDVPWHRYEGSSAGWTLRVWSERGTHDVFGIPADIDRRAARPAAGSGDPVLGRLSFGRRSAASEYAGPRAERPSPKVTPGHASEVLDQAKGEWDEAVAAGELEAAEARTSVHWNWVNVVVALTGLAAVVVTLGGVLG